MMTLLNNSREALAHEAPVDPLTIAEVDVCAVDDLQPDRGVCALVAGEPVAVFRCSPDDELYAVGNVDPYTGASVLSRGIVGSIGGRPVVASPLFKNRFDLGTGESLDNPDIRIAIHAARVENGRVLVSVMPLALGVS